jgi:DNA-binding response OmpR family regulator
MKTDKQIWIIEDDVGAQFVYDEILGIRYLLRFFINVRTFTKSLMDMPRDRYPDLIIADLRLPGESFVDFLQTGQGKGVVADIPVFVVSSLDDVDVLRSCFALGVTDYITKPFRKAELIVRIERILVNMVTKNQIEQKKIRLDPVSLTLSYLDKPAVNLTAKEFQIMTALSQRFNEVISRSELSSMIWGNLKVDPKTLDVHLVSLRRKLNEFDLEVRYQAPNAFCLTDKITM